MTYSHWWIYDGVGMRQENGRHVTSGELAMALTQGVSGGVVLDQPFDIVITSNCGYGKQGLSEGTLVKVQGPALILDNVDPRKAPWTNVIGGEIPEAMIPEILLQEIYWDRKGKLAKLFHKCLLYCLGDGQTSGGEKAKPGTKTSR